MIEIDWINTVPLSAREMGVRAKKIIYDNRGATAKTVDLIKAFL